MPVKRKSLLDEVSEELTKPNTLAHILLGLGAGCLTGILGKKTNGLVATGVGGTAVILSVANHAGYIKVNWNKVDKVVDRVQKETTGQGPSWTDKMERYVDRKLDKAEDKIRKEMAMEKTVKPIHFFLASFFAGTVLGRMVV